MLLYIAYVSVVPPLAVSTRVLDSNFAAPLVALTVVWQLHTCRSMNVLINVFQRPSCAVT
jgi:hypothetical protein